MKNILFFVFGRSKSAQGREDINKSAVNEIGISRREGNAWLTLNTPYNVIGIYLEFEKTFSRGFPHACDLLIREARGIVEKSEIEIHRLYFRFKGDHLLAHDSIEILPEEKSESVKRYANGEISRKLYIIFVITSEIIA